MNWLQFLLWVTGIYVLYYLGNIFFDIALSKRIPAGPGQSNELTFSESFEPTVYEDADTTAHQNVAATKVPEVNPEPEVLSSGGVSLKELFQLSRQEAIIYTRPVSFQL